MTHITLSPQQAKAEELFVEWFDNWETDVVFRLFGFAGTGKTTIMRQLVSQIKGSILYGAYTGKAALVMQKNDIPATTIHSMIYRFVQPDAHKYKTLSEQVKGATGAEAMELKKQLEELRQPKFVLNQDSDVEASDLIVLDEVSMVDEDMAKDLLGFGVPILVLGDPGQLPPIRGTGYFTEKEPNIMLTEIHRQAEGNPIIQLATKARLGKPISVGEYGESSVIIRSDWTSNMAMNADQILVGKNKTRRAINRRVRKLLGLDGTYPKEGERLICLRNDRKKGLLNGMQGIVMDVETPDAFSISLKIKMEGMKEEVELNVLRAVFDEYEQEGALEEFNTTYPYWVRKDVTEFDYAYAITVHKAQGSQWDHVTLVDDGFGRDVDTRTRWLYTAITRAAETITVVR